MKCINFITNTGNSIFELELYKTLIHFVEYDFTYFWEQAIDFGLKMEASGKYDVEQSNIVKNLISKCHPYFEAKSNTEFSNIVIDCVIEYICRTRGLGLEGLWIQYISPKNAYEREIFSRISAYKTNKAINEWVNLIRMQAYATKKTSFIFDGDICSVAECMARNKYFDLAYSVAANEISYPQEELPSVQCFPLGQMPNTAFILKRPAKDIYEKYQGKFENLPTFTKKGINDNIRDSYALDAYDVIQDIKRPTDMEMFTAIESFRYLPDMVYLPNSFKAIVDLEFIKMFENGIILQLCPSCNRYFKQTAEYNGLYCNRVTKSGNTCREENDVTSLAHADNYSIYDRMNDLQSSLLEKIGGRISLNEFNDWVEYLERLKANIKEKSATIDDLESFLDYTEQMYGKMEVDEFNDHIEN